MATYSNILAWKILDRRAWQATLHGVANSWTQLSDPQFFINTVYINIVYKSESEVSQYTDALLSEPPGEACPFIIFLCTLIASLLSFSKFYYFKHEEK